MFCENCGSKIEKIDKFCINCGKSTEINKQDKKIETKTENISNKKFKPQKFYNNTKRNLIILGVGVLIFISFIIYPTIQNNLKEEKEALARSQKEKETLAVKQQEEFKDIKNKLTELENKKPQIIYKTIKDTTPKEKTTTEIVKEWSPQVVYIYCEWNYSNGTLYESGSGSGFLTNYSDGSIQIMTNKHVILSDNKYTPSFCTTYFLNGEIYKTLCSKENFNWNQNYDIANVALSGLSDYLTNLAKRGGFYCSNEPTIGDKIVVLGYPGIGSSKGITATEGIISGIESYYYVTSAKIDQGNSGGIAVSVKDNCIIGMPSASVTGSIESLGRILSSKAILSN